VLRVVRTVLRCFYRQLRAKAGVFVEALIAGAILLVCCVTWLVTAQHNRCTIHCDGRRVEARGCHECASQPCGHQIHAGEPS